MRLFNLSTNLDLNRLKKSEPGKKELQSRGPVWFGISIAGAAVSLLSVYRCHYSYVQGYDGSSLTSASAGISMIGSFCVLTVAVIAGIRMLISREDRFWPISTMVVSGVAMMGLLGLFILGIML